ncbi:hypothetical protein [Halogranum rubrum]|nr:hypothetical protein [Halogranum rubrum]
MTELTVLTESHASGRERGASQVVNGAGPLVPLKTGGKAAGDETNVLTEI